MPFLNNDPSLKERRRQLRNNSTREEVVLWNYLKNKNLGKRFRRQFSIGPYIADFYCMELMLVIEIDGTHHYNQWEYDAERDRFMAGHGCTVMRFSNNDINNRLKDVLELIQKTIQRLD